MGSSPRRPIQLDCGPDPWCRGQHAALFTAEVGVRAPWGYLPSGQSSVAWSHAAEHDGGGRHRAHERDDERRQLVARADRGDEVGRVGEHAGADPGGGAAPPAEGAERAEADGDVAAGRGDRQDLPAGRVGGCADPGAGDDTGARERPAPKATPPALDAGDGGGGDGAGRTASPPSAGGGRAGRRSRAPVVALPLDHDELAARPRLCRPPPPRHCEQQFRGRGARGRARRGCRPAHARRAAGHPRRATPHGAGDTVRAGRSRAGRRGRRSRGSGGSSGRVRTWVSSHWFAVPGPPARGPPVRDRAAAGCRRRAVITSQAAAGARRASGSAATRPEEPGDIARDPRDLPAGRRGDGEEDDLRTGRRGGPPPRSRRALTPRSRPARASARCPGAGGQLDVVDEVVRRVRLRSAPGAPALARFTTNALIEEHDPVRVRDSNRRPRRRRGTRAGPAMERHRGLAVRPPADLPVELLPVTDVRERRGRRLELRVQASLLCQAPGDGSR